MDRRRFLATVALVGVTGGCSESVANQSPTAPRHDETPTPSQETSTATPTPEGEQPAKHVRVSDLQLDAADGGALYDMVRMDDGVVCSGHLDGTLALVALDSDLDVQWSKTYPEWEVGEFVFNIGSMPSIGMASDGGYTVGAIPENTEQEAIIFKTDSRGQIEWTRPFEASPRTVSVKLVDLGDGTYAYAWSDRAVDLASVTVVGYDPLTASTLWEQEYNDYWIDRMEPTTGGCLLSGRGLRTGLWMSKIESNGMEAWQDAIDDYAFNGGRQINDGFLLWGRIVGNGQTDRSQVRVLDNARETRWTKEYEGPNKYLHTVLPTEDGYLCLNEADEGVWLTKLTATGDIGWQTRYGIVRRDDIRLEAAQPVGDRYIITGGFDERDTTDDGWVAVVEE